MRQEGGYDKIVEAIKLMGEKPMEHIIEYDPTGGDDNRRRLTGLHETASIDEFSWGVAHRGCSIRIPRSVADEKKGYFELLITENQSTHILNCNKIIALCGYP
eukprot:sb/3478264/